MMKKIVYLSFIVLVTISCRAQILATEDAYVYYENQDIGLPDDITYVKDINNVLDKFVGVWIGTYNNKTYEIRIVDFTDTDDDVYEDLLYLKYIITDNSTGNVLIDTTNLSNNDGNVVKGLHLTEHGIYKLIYNGENFTCGQHGTMFLDIGSNHDTLRMFMVPGSELIDSEDCPNGQVEQIMPLNFMTLNRQ